MDKCDMAAMIDHTILKPEAIQADVVRIVEKGAAAGTFLVCVSLLTLPLDIPEGLQVVCVVSSPPGAVKPEVKVFEAALTVVDGADEIDTVINTELVKDGRLIDLEGEVAAVRRVVPFPRVLKVTIEAAALTDDETVVTCRASMAASADFVKASTGFHPAGDASTHAVALMCAMVREALGVKASDGIRDAKIALAMVEVGVSRLGMSAADAILAGLEGQDDGATRAHPPVGEPRSGSRDGLDSELRH